jgi:hypothetical protein
MPPVSPVEIGGCRRRRAGGLRDELRRAALHVLHDPVDLAPGVAEAILEPGVEPALELLLALPQGVVSRPEPRLLAGDLLPLPREQAPLVLERLQLARHRGEVLGELRLPTAPVLAGGVDDGGRQAQLRGDLEREARAGRPVDQPVGRLERAGREAERRARDAGRRRGVRLQRVVVRRRHHVRAARPEVVDHRHAERAALDRVGARPDLVEQHETGEREVPVHRRDVGHVRREGAEVRRDRLLVADVGEHRPEHRQGGPFGRRDVQPRLRHQGEEPGRLERHGLAAGVRPGDDEDGGGRRKDHVHRHRRLGPDRAGLALVLLVAFHLAQPRVHGRDEQGMAGGPQVQRAVGAERRAHAADQPREARAGLHDIELRGGPEHPLQIERPGAERVGEREEDPPDFLGLLLGQGHDVVVDLDGAERLEEEARPARGAAVDDARDRAAVLGAHEQHVAAVAVGDDLVLQVLGGVAAAEVRLEGAAQPAPLLAQAVAHRPQLGAGVVEDLAGRVDRPAHLGDLALEGGEAGHDLLQQGKLRRRRAPDPVRALVHRLEERGEPRQAQRLERPPLDGEHRERVLEVGWRAQRKARILRKEPDRLGGRGEQGLDGTDLDRRLEHGQARLPEGRLGEASNDLGDTIELEGPQGAGMHATAGCRVRAGDGSPVWVSSQRNL